MMEFLLGGVACCGACLFSNPLEVVKTRMQLQGEFKARGTYHRHYRNVFHAFYTIGKVDGMLALQKGLVSALWYQLFMNGVRLGIYQKLTDFGFTKDRDGKVIWHRSLIAGAVSGCCGAVVGSPFYLVKTHLQAQANTLIAVGYQHKHHGLRDAFVGILRTEGVGGMWRGVTGAMARVMVGSAVQLSTFSTSKEFVKQSKIFSDDSIMVPFTASMVGGVMVVCCMTPFDVISTRLYNQGVDAKGRGLYYSGFLDCFYKIFRQEGVLAFYKGWSASWFRLAPHTVLSLMFWDRAKSLYKDFQST